MENEKIDGDTYVLNFLSGVKHRLVLITLVAPTTVFGLNFLLWVTNIELNRMTPISC